MVTFSFTIQNWGKEEEEQGVGTANCCPFYRNIPVATVDYLALRFLHYGLCITV